MKNKRKSLLIVFGLLIFMLAAGGSYWAYQTYWKPEPAVVKEQDAAINANITALLAGLPAATPDLSAYPVTLENCGRKLTFQTPPKRVIGLWQPSNELLLALGVQGRVIGFAGMYDKLPLEFSAAAKGVPTLGSILTLYIPNKEEMFKANPDLIVTEGLYTFAFDASQGYATIEQIEAMGAQIYSSGSICQFKAKSNRGIDSVYQDLDALGKIFGISARVDELIKRLKMKEASMLQAVVGQKPVRVAFLNGDSESIYVLNGAIWSDLMKKAGGENVFEGQTTSGKMSAEVFAAIDADVILYGIFPVNGPIPGRNPERVEAYLKAIFPNIPAVKNGRLYPIPIILTESSVRVVDGLALIAQSLHPESFK